ncbi:MAG TPA: SDR family oxidoreductase [Candidatus Dormibacteraeota bacterium]|nr:SDR family oxidoreductase [Candidatus Dormibacteraeota bacterium]
MDSQSVVVITGASAGVGRAAARAFAQHGVRRIGLLARGRAGLDATTRELADLGVQVCAVECDVADAPAVDAAASRIEEELGPIEVWVNNAMTAVFARVADTTAEEFRRVTEVTYLGFVHGTLAALQRMLPRDRGVVVQVGSALAYRGIPLQASYCGAKHAMVGFTESLRTELLHDHSGVQVTMVHLPAMNTPQFSWVRTRLRRHPQPVPPIYQPEVAAEAIVYAASHPRRREHFVGMPTVITVLGNKLLPALGDRYLARSGIDSQLTDRPIPANRPDNLFAPVDQEADHGSHGIFDDRAHPRSLQTWVAEHPAPVVGALAGVGAACAAVARAVR